MQVDTSASFDTEPPTVAKHVKTLDWIRRSTVIFVPLAYKVNRSTGIINRIKTTVYNSYGYKNSKVMSQVF